MWLEVIRQKISQHSTRSGALVHWDTCRRGIRWAAEADMSGCGRTCPVAAGRIRLGFRGEIDPKMER